MNPIADRNLNAINAHPDGTWTARVVESYRTQNFTMLTLALPAHLAAGSACGRYILARCGAVTQYERRAGWDMYLRRPLFAVSRRMAAEPNEQELWSFVAPALDDPGMRWLSALADGDQVNVIGPLGNECTIPADRKNLLLAGPAALIPALLPAANQVLDRGGRVAAMVRADGELTELRRILPWSIELHAASSDADWMTHLHAALPWTDTLVAVVSPSEVQPLADSLRLKRFQLTQGDAYVFVLSDLVCGYGACLACVIPTAGGGFTRACVHGPIFPLTALAA